MQQPTGRPPLTEHEQHLLDRWHAVANKWDYMTEIPLADASRLVDLLNDLYKPPPVPPFKRRSQKEQAA